MLALLTSPEYHNDANPLVLAALKRSFTNTMCSELKIDEIGSVDILVCVNPLKDWSSDLIRWAANSNRKLMIFGDVPAVLLSELGWENCELPSNLEQHCKAPPAKTYATSQSSASLIYVPGNKLGTDTKLSRPFERFDFTNEWNNHGYGAIRGTYDIWSVSTGVRAGKDTISNLAFDGKMHSSFVALGEICSTQVFWINRPVGFIDSQEWRQVEEFCSGFHADTHPCIPLVREIPYGFDFMATMRLDCDEDVKSARNLWKNYVEWDIPFSIALLTSILEDGEHDEFINEVIDLNGSILSHSVSHAPNWGGSYEAARQECLKSKKAIRQITGEDVKFAVSPFHQNPEYSVKALSDEGYLGFIGGIIANDPEFMLARGGQLAQVHDSFVSHSQQCMLHGDCLLDEEMPLKAYYHAVDLAFCTHTLFGYLDHPFSERYQYGWKDEESRSNAHKELISYIKSKANKPVFVNDNTALEFILLKSQVEITNIDSKWCISVPEHSLPFKFAVEFKGGLSACSSGKNLL